MRRGAKPSKAKVESKRLAAPKSPMSEDARVRDLEERLAEALAQLQTCRRELAESQEQQTATAEILRVISSSPTDVQPVLEAVVQNASRLCGAGNVSLYRAEGSLMRKVAEHGPRLTALRVGETRPITRTTVSGRAMVDRATIHLPDHQAPEAAQEYPDSRRDTGIRTAIGIPLLREGTAIGAFTAYRTECRPFADAQIALLQTSRRPGGDRHRERAPVHGAAGEESCAHGGPRSSERSPRATDGHERDSAGDQSVADRRAAGLRHDRPKRRETVRRTLRRTLSIRRRAAPHGCPS